MYRGGALVSDIDRTLGEHGARLSAIESSVKGIAEDVKTLLADKNQAEGSKRTVYSIAATLGAVAGLAAEAASRFFQK